MSVLKGTRGMVLNHSGCTVGLEGGPNGSWVSRARYLRNLLVAMVGWQPKSGHLWTNTVEIDQWLPRPGTYDLLRVGFT